jgi:osmotically-inducible protein OsmY
MRTDEQIKTSIVDRLASDSRIDASSVKVVVNHGEVTLSGTVLTYFDKVNAKDITWYVSGVTKVKNDLDVSLPSTLPIHSDIQIRESVENLLRWNAQIDHEKISVKVEDGQVTLEGSLSTYWQTRLAEEEASRVSGVVNIVNKLVVVPTEKISDEIIGERLMDRIEQSSPMRVDDIGVRVRDGEVTLSGTLPSYSDWTSIYNTAVNTRGVTDVKDQLMISYA